MQDPHPTSYSLLIAKDFRHVHYQILMINLRKEFLKLNANMDIIIQNAKHLELISKIFSAVLNTQMLNIQMFMLQQEIPKNV